MVPIAKRLRWLGGISWYWLTLILAVLICGSLFLIGWHFSIKFGLYEYLAGAGAALLIGALQSTTVQSVLRRIDWRLQAVMIATAISIVATLIILALGLGTHPDTFFGAVFASWVGGVAFFAVVGTVVAVVSLARPEEESAETRARILFRRKTGRHIDYMVDKIGHIFEQYSEVVENKIEILDFCDNKFLLGFEGHTRLRSYIDDIPSNYTSHMEMAGIGPPPAGKDDKPNRIVRLLVNEQSQHKQAALGDSFKFEFTTVIQPNEACDIRQRFELWVEAENEPSAFVAVRYTQLVGLRLDNLWNKDVFVQVLVEDRRARRISLECRIPPKLPSSRGC